MAVSNPKPMHPGRVLAEIHMTKMGLNQSQLARKLGCAHRKINEIVNCKRGIAPEFALKLEEVLGTPAEVWVRMQAEYDLGVARKKKRA